MRRAICHSVLSRSCKVGVSIGYPFSKVFPAYVCLITFELFNYRLTYPAVATDVMCKDCPELVDREARDNQEHLSCFKLLEDAVNSKP